MLNLTDSSYYKRAFNFFIFATVILVITIILAYFFSPSIETIKQAGEKSPDRVSGTEGLEKVWGFIVSNAFSVTYKAVILSIIPIPYLYSIHLLATAIIPGLMLGFIVNFDTYKGFIGIISYIPHYTLEVGGHCLVLSGLYMINKCIRRKITNIFRKEKKVDISFRNVVLNFCKVFVCIALPVFIIAAFTETYVADFLFELMT